MSTQSRSIPVRRGAPLFPARRAHLLTTRYAGGGVPLRGTVRSPRGMRPLRGPAGNDCGHSRCVWNRLVRQPVPYASENLPLAAFHCLRGTGDGGRGTVSRGGKETGNLSFGGKGYQPGDRPLCCRGGGLHELLPDLQRL